MINKRRDGKWLLNIRLGGARGKQIKKVFRTQNEAKNFEVWAKSQQQQNQAWQPEKPDTRRLGDLIDIWWTAHGKSLKAGADTYTRLKALCKKVGNPVAANFSAQSFSEYRKERIKEGLTANTVNREQAYLRSVFNELSRLGEWSKENPLKRIRQYKIQQKELAFLTLDNIQSLLDALGKSSNPHAVMVSKICLATGARWSEAENLKLADIGADQIQLTSTKNNKVRAIKISEELRSEIAQFAVTHNRKGRLFESCYSAFREAVDRAGLKLPDGQLTHILRHTFASHFMMGGGSILALQRILDHQNLNITMRYAHLAPEHLAEAKTLNPLAQLSEKQAV